MAIEQVDLDALGLTHGDATRLDGKVDVGAVTLGGQDYTPSPVAPEVRVDISRTSSGYALRLRFTVSLEGPCFRCLEPAANRVTVDVREVDQPVDGVAGSIPGSRPGIDEGDDEEDETAAELISPYVEDGILNIAGWTRDALILALPNQILCRDDCLGLCAYCGESLNGADPGAHDHGQNIDPRWSKLRDLT